MTKVTLLAVPVVVLLTAALANAATIQVLSDVDLSSNDSFEWDQVRVLDDNGTPGDAADDFAAAQNSPMAVVSSLARTASIDDSTAFTGLIQGLDFFGIFAAGDNVLFTGDALDVDPFTDTFTMTFVTPIAGVGTHIQSNLLGSFTASLEVFNGATSLGSFAVGGDSDFGGPNTAPFLGIRSDSANIDRAVFTLTTNAGAGLAIDRLLTTDTPFVVDATVPEPVSLVLLTTGLVGAAVRRRRR